MAVNRFEVYLVILDSIVGSEIQKTRPSLVVSPDVRGLPVGPVWRHNGGQDDY